MEAVITPTKYPSPFTQSFDDTLSVPIPILFAFNTPTVDTPETLSCSKIPTEVKEELTTLDARVVDERISDPFILKPFPLATPRLIFDTNSLPETENWNVLLPSPEFIVIPAPSAAISFIAPSAIWIFLSSTVTVVELMIV